MDFQSLLSNNQYADYSLWSDSSSAASSSDFPSSPISNASTSSSSLSSLSTSSLVDNNNSMCDLSALVGSTLTSLGEYVNDVNLTAFNSSSDDVRISGPRKSVNDVFTPWLDFHPPNQYENDLETFQGDILNQTDNKKWCSSTEFSSSSPPCFDFSPSAMSDCETVTGHLNKPKRKRLQSKSQRKAANVRERRRMVYLNDAFDSLRTILPAFSYEKSLSRIETLKLAIKYISFMKDVTNSDGK